MIFFQTTFPRFLIGIIALLLADALGAHPAHPAYLQLRIEENRMEGQWSIPLHELQRSDKLPIDLENVVNWSDLEAVELPLSHSVFAELTLSQGDQRHDLERRPMLYEERNGEAYLVFPFSSARDADGPPADLNYGVFELFGSSHRCLLEVETAEGSFQTVLRPGESAVALQLSSSATSGGLLHLLGEGVWHILIGYDHILFLLVLVLPLVVSAESPKVLTNRAIKVVSAFALSHSITLALAALGWVRPPMALVEIIIALTVGLAAVVSFFPRGRDLGVGIALVFGLVHGFGFANVLTGLDLTGASLVPALLAFNVGVELGQLLIIGALLPAALFLRHTRFYQQIVVPGGSLVIVTISIVWIVTRMQGALDGTGL